MTKTTEVLERLLSIKQTAELLGTSVKTVRRMIAEGQIDTVRIRRQHRIAPSTVRRIANRGTQ